MKTDFKSAYEAGFDAGVNGSNTFNTHLKWFRTIESMKYWETGKRNAEIKEGLIDEEYDNPKNKGSQRSPFGMWS